MIDSSRLDTVILDLGGVLIDVHPERSKEAFKALGVRRFEEHFSMAGQTAMMDRFERGELSPQQFRDEVRKALHSELKDDQIDACWNAMLGSIPPERMQLVEDLRHRYRVYLLSNTNKIHIPVLLQLVRRQHGIADLRQEFDGSYFSFELGMRKPEERIFHHVLKDTYSSPATTLFIDDSRGHVESARKAGLPSEHLDLSQEDVIGLVQRLGLLT